MVSDLAISPDDSEGVVLAKVMEVAKEIRPDDKKRVKTGVKTPINRRPGWVPGGSVVCWRMLAFLGAGEARREGRRRGWWCCRWRPGRRGDGLPVVAFWVACLAASGGLPAGGWAVVIRRQSAAAIRRYLISH